MKSKIIPVLSTAVILSASLFSVASAQSMQAYDAYPNMNLGFRTEDGAIVAQNTNIYSDNTSRVEIGDSGRGTTTIKIIKDDNTKSESENNKDENSNSKAEFSSESHGVVMSNLVHSLINVADREGGIGDEVREIASKQEASATTTIHAMKDVESRGSMRIFFFGSDYKNLNVIKVELATTTSNIARLNSVLIQTQNISDRAEIAAEIKVLEAEQIRLNAYITVWEDKFSLFGWMFK